MYTVMVNIFNKPLKNINFNILLFIHQPPLRVPAGGVIVLDKYKLCLYVHILHINAWGSE